MKMPFYTLFVVFLGLFVILWWNLVHQSVQTISGPNSRIAERVKSYFYRNSSDAISVPPKNAQVTAHYTAVIKDNTIKDGSVSSSGGGSDSDRQDVESNVKSKLELILTDKSLSTGAHSLTHNIPCLLMQPLN